MVRHYEGMFVVCLYVACFLVGWFSLNFSNLNNNIIRLVNSRF